MARVGFIKDYRKELDCDIWIMPPLYHRVWQYLKYEVNHTENEIPMKDGTKFLIKKGQKLTSYRNIAKSVGWYEGPQWKEPNPKTIKTICDWMEKNNMIIQEHGKGNRQYTLITIVNWGLYQNKKDDEVTVNKQESNTKVTDNKQSADINKKVKNYKENIYSENVALNQAILDFIDMRKTIRKPITTGALTLIINKLNKITDDENMQIEILNQSIINNWQGVFPLKEIGNKPNGIKNIPNNPKRRDDF